MLLNNDTIVTDAWLNQLVSLARTSNTIGMVGPKSIYASPPQLVKNLPYRIGSKKSSTRQNGTIPDDFLVDVSEFNRFAHKFREEHRGKKWWPNSSMAILP